MENIKSKKQFATIALWEGISTVVLFVIAMPLKYLAGIENAVKYPGWIHGLLFVLYLGFLIKVAIEYSWSFGRIMKYFVASLIPFAPFFVERELKKEIRAADLKSAVETVEQV